jgi:hypothetical protein
VGWTGSNNPNLTSNNIRAFVWENGTTTVLGRAPGAVNSMAHSVTSEGLVTIQAKTQSSPVVLVNSYTYSDGSMTSLSTPEGFDRTYPAQAANGGLIVGGASDTATGGQFHACVWSGQTVAILEDKVAESDWNFMFESGGAGVSQDQALLISGFTNAIVQVGFVLRSQLPPVGDTNCDQRIDIDDLLNVINSWGPCTGCPADFNYSGVVDIDDLLVVINEWSPRSAKGGE